MKAQLGEYQRGYRDDAGLDIVLDNDITIIPGFQTFNLHAQYTPEPGEVAFLISRGSTAAKGIFPLSVAIDAGYTGRITAWVFNASGLSHTFKKGDRVFGIVNLQLGRDRVPFRVLKNGERGSRKLNSSGTLVNHVGVEK